MQGEPGFKYSGDSDDFLFLPRDSESGTLVAFEYHYPNGTVVSAGVMTLTMEFDYRYSVLDPLGWGTGLEDGHLSLAGPVVGLGFRSSIGGNSRLSLSAEATVSLFVGDDSFDQGGFGTLEVSAQTLLLTARVRADFLLSKRFRMGVSASYVYEGDGTDVTIRDSVSAVRVVGRLDSYELVAFGVSAGLVW